MAGLLATRWWPLASSCLSCLRCSRKTLTFRSLWLGGTLHEGLASRSQCSGLHQSVRFGRRSVSIGAMRYPRSSWSHYSTSQNFAWLLWQLSQTWQYDSTIQVVAALIAKTLQRWHCPRKCHRWESHQHLCSQADTSPSYQTLAFMNRK